MALKISGRVTRNKGCPVDLTILLLSMLGGTTLTLVISQAISIMWVMIHRKYFLPTSSVLWKGASGGLGGGIQPSLPSQAFYDVESLQQTELLYEEHRLPLALLGGPTWARQSFGKLREDVAWSVVGCFESTPGPWGCTSPSFWAPPSWI